MKEEQRSAINYFFVKVFNQILSWEEQSFKEMGISDITLRELHVIEAVYHLLDKGENRMSEIARYLAITPGSLTTAVNCLVKKGYLMREASPSDRRVVMIVPTKTAEEVNNMHTHFHKTMIDKVLSCIEKDDVEVAVKILEGLNKFFSEEKSSRK
ncbi:MAG: MarR family transcriptional regulator [bacterium]|nr:MarR family transcriptional regulator [bacterium]